VALDAAGAILVTDENAGTNSSGALFSVNALTGNRTLISDFGSVAQGPLGVDPSGLTVDASGNVLVIDWNAGTDSRGALFRINAPTGVRTVISDFGDAAQGPIGNGPFGLVIGAAGKVLVIDFSAGTGFDGALISVDSTTGTRTQISDFGAAAQGPLGDDPVGVALDAAGAILVTDENAGTNSSGALFSVNALTGVRTMISDFGNAAQGPFGHNPSGLAIDAAGAILVIDKNAWTLPKGALFRVDPATGGRALVSDFGAAAQGPLGVEPTGVAVVPEAAPVGETNLVVSQSDSPDPLSTGGTLTYTIDIANIGSGDATDVELTDTLPAGVILASANSSQGTCSGSSTVICSLGGLASAATATVEMAVTTATPGTLTNTVTVNSAEPDSDDTNNTDAEQTIVNAVSKLACGGHTATKAGTANSETIIGSAGADIIHGLGGNDEIRGQGGNDIICGGLGIDFLRGGIGTDRLLGGPSNDKLSGDAGNDALDGGTGADVCSGGTGSDSGASCEIFTQ
jgi:uncharacterized repeat protein (TIGR01451 family)